MGIGRDVATTWQQMKDKFMIKYHDFCRPSSRGGNELFKMSYKEDEPLEYYLERFLFYVKNSRHTTLPLKSLKLLVLNGLSEEGMDALDMIGVGDISKENFDEICEPYRNYSRVSMKINKKC